MWYKTGTINLIANNATVTGTGTAWADAKFGVMPGMILLAPDNKLYEVKQVNSNTSLTLNSNYSGSTASGQSYAIITTYEGDISQFSARFAAMLTFFQGSRNDTVSWFTGSGDMTFTKDDGTKLTVPTLAKVQADYVSRSSTLDQSIASSVLMSKPTRLASTTTPEFTPTTQGAWVSWNRDPSSANSGYAAATDFINHKGGGTGGWNFWNSNGTATNLSAKLSPAGFFTTMGGLTSYNDQVMQANTEGGNVIIRFKGADGVEKGAFYNSTSTGQMTLRWGGQQHSLIGQADGQLNIPKTLTFNMAYTTPAAVPDVANLPVMFRGADTAQFANPNNINIGTWYGFAVVPTCPDNITAAGVTRGSPVFYVNARTGTAHVINNMYVGTSAVLKVGDHGIGGTTAPTVSDPNAVGTNQFVRIPSGTKNSPGTAAWAGINSGFDGGSRYQLLWEQGTSAVNLQTRIREPLGNWSPWKKIVTDESVAQIVAPLIPSTGNGERYCKIAEQSITTTGNRGMVFMVTQGRQYGELGMDISYIYFCARGATTTSLAANGLHHIKLGSTSANSSANDIHCGAVYNSDTSMWELWVSGNGYNCPRVSLIGNVETGTMNGVTTDVDLVWRPTRPSGYTIASEKRTWTDFNTTVDANGFLKKASPIARLSSNPEKMPDEYLDGFTLSGLAAVNGEAAGVTAERVSVGVYKVTGSLGFALEGWNIEVPQDVNGNRLCFVATEAAEDGTITVKVSKRRFDIDTAAIVAGESMDIPEGRWIDLRLEMPPVEEVQSEPEPESHEGEMASE
ncbi:hypothetical protein [Serratia sp. PL7]|uniref:phage tail fiber protein n=1 Tax=Serratia sp. PL7 TaxID=2952201 RepID=UPI001B3C74F1|nr:hypothetical protein [Serratia sp. PL7]